MKVNTREMDKLLKKIHDLETEYNAIGEKYDYDEEWSEEDVRRGEELKEELRKLIGCAPEDRVSIESIANIIKKLLEVSIQ